MALSITDHWIYLYCFVIRIWYSKESRWGARWRGNYGDTALFLGPIQFRFYKLHPNVQAWGQIRLEKKVWR